MSRLNIYIYNGAFSERFTAMKKCSKSASNWQSYAQHFLTRSGQLSDISRHAVQYNIL